MPASMTVCNEYEPLFKDSFMPISICFIYWPWVANSKREWICFLFHFPVLICIYFVAETMCTLSGLFLGLFREIFRIFYFDQTNYTTHFWKLNKKELEQTAFSNLPSGIKWKREKSFYDICLNQTSCHLTTLFGTRRSLFLPHSVRRWLQLRTQLQASFTWVITAYSALVTAPLISRDCVNSSTTIKQFLHVIELASSSLLYLFAGEDVLHPDASGMKFASLENKKEIKKFLCIR